MSLSCFDPSRVCWGKCFIWDCWLEYSQKGTLTKLTLKTLSSLCSCRAAEKSMRGSISHSCRLFQHVLSVSVRLVIRAIQVYTHCVFKAQLKELTVNNNPSNQFALQCKVLLPRAAEEPLMCFVPARKGKDGWSGESEWWVDNGRQRRKWGI